MSGIYILQTKDGYRVAHTYRYGELVGMDADINYYIVGKIAKDLFSECFCYDILDEAIKHAQKLTERAESKTKGYVTKCWHDQFEVDFDTE